MVLGAIQENHQPENVGIRWKWNQKKKKMEPLIKIRFWEREKEKEERESEEGVIGLEKLLEVVVHFLGLLRNGNGNEKWKFMDLSPQ